MAFSINRVTLVGNVSNDPQLTYTPKGIALLKFNLATNYSRKNDTGEWEDVPSFHRITVWNKLAEFLGGALKKGEKAYVEGRLEYGSYEKDGITRYTTDIIGQSIIPMGGRHGGGMGSSTSFPSSGPTQAASNSSNMAASDSKTTDVTDVKPASKSSTLKQSNSPKDEVVPVDDIPF